MLLKAHEDALDDLKDEDKKGAKQKIRDVLKKMGIDDIAGRCEDCEECIRCVECQTTGTNCNNCVECKRCEGCKVMEDAKKDGVSKLEDEIAALEELIK